MADLVLAAIPSHINTIERLFIWSGMALQSAANGQQVNVVAGGGSAPTIQVQVAKTVDNVDRFVVAGYIPVDFDALNSPSEKTWMATKEITNSQPGDNLLAN